MHAHLHARHKPRFHFPQMYRGSSERRSAQARAETRARAVAIVKGVSRKSGMRAGFGAISNAAIRTKRRVATRKASLAKKASLGMAAPAPELWQTRKNGKAVADSPKLGQPIGDENSKPPAAPQSSRELLAHRWPCLGRQNWRVVCERQA